jgi:hypothetical protein
VTAEPARLSWTYYLARLGISVVLLDADGSPEAALLAFDLG